MLGRGEKEASDMSMKFDRIAAVIWGVFSAYMLVFAIAFIFQSHYAGAAIHLILAGLGGHAAVSRWRKSESKVLSAPSGGGSLRFHAIAAAAIYYFDAFFFGDWGGIAFLVMIIFIFVGLGKTLMRALRGQRILMTPLRNMAIYTICFVAAFSTFKLNNEIAKSRADKVISAVKQYKAKYQRYPETLQTMVPEFLPSVPQAKYTFLGNNFMYWRHAYENLPENATLLYIRIWPFGRPIFSFEQDQWGFID
jgi:hypothetical protein